MKRTPIFRRNQYFVTVFLILWLFTSGSGFFLSTASAEPTEDVFPNIEGWKKAENIEIYAPAELYSYINGAAEVYLLYDFQELRVVEYLDQNDAAIVIEMYYHKTPAHAFGIYSQERPVEGDFLGGATQVMLCSYIELPKEIFDRPTMIFLAL